MAAEKRAREVVKAMEKSGLSLTCQLCRSADARAPDPQCYADLLQRLPHLCSSCSARERVGLDREGRNSMQAEVSQLTASITGAWQPRPRRGRQLRGQKNVSGSVRQSVRLQRRPSAETQKIWLS